MDNLVKLSKKTRKKIKVRNANKGITLIALVITIIVLLILAGVSIAMLTGENGILTKSAKAVEETAHQAVYEGLKLKSAEYVLEKTTGEYEGTLIKYLLKNEYVSQKNGIDGYIVNVKKATNSSQKYGNGTDGKTDVYKLEETVLAEGSLGKVASIGDLKISAVSSTESNQYNLVYCKSENEKLIIGTLEDNAKEDELITFTIGVESYNAEKGMTWEKWVDSKFNTITDDYKIDDCYERHVCLKSEDSDDWIYNSDDNDLESCDNTIEDGGKYYLVSSHPECVFPNSKILVSKSGETKDAKDLKEGESIAYYNFETQKTEIGKVEKVYIHKDATNFVKYEFEDGTYLEATDYHPIYTKQGWKSLTQRNGYPIPQVGDEVKTQKGWKKLIKIEEFEGMEDCYDFAIITEDGQQINNYFANGTLVQGSYKKY